MQSAQHKAPQKRQWCRRVVREKPAPHWLHCGPSGSHWLLGTGTSMGAPSSAPSSSSSGGGGSKTSLSLPSLAKLPLTRSCRLDRAAVNSRFPFKASSSTAGVSHVSVKSGGGTESVPGFTSATTRAASRCRSIIQLRATGDRMSNRPRMLPSYVGSRLRFSVTLACTSAKKLSSSAAIVCSGGGVCVVVG